MKIQWSLFYKKSGIYCFTNKVNNKKYIGCSKNIYARYRHHLCGRSEAPKLINAVKKYGWENFDISILEECETEKLNERETYWIKFYKTTNDEFGYNIIENMDSQHIRIVSQETKDKIKISLKKAVLEGRRQSVYFKGQKHTEESKQLMSIGRRNSNCRSNNKPIILIHFETKKEFRFNKIKDATKFIGTYYSQKIVNAIKNQTVYLNYFWKLQPK